MVIMYQASPSDPTLLDEEQYSFFWSILFLASIGFVSTFSLFLQKS